MGKTIKLMRDASYNVYILPDARAKMEMYCELCEKEIGWLGFVKKYPGTGYLITDVVLLKQEVHATTTEIDPAALLDFWAATPAEQQADIKLWGHSHVNMSPSPSGQDDSQMDYFKDGNDWFIRLITNKKGDMNITIYDYANVCMTTKKKQTKQEECVVTGFTKSQILASNKYLDRKDVLNVLLDEGVQYTVEQVDSIIEKFMKGMVK